ALDLFGSRIFMLDVALREVNAPIKTIFDASNYLNPTNLGIMLTHKLFLLTTIYAQLWVEKFYKKKNTWINLKGNSWTCLPYCMTTGWSMHIKTVLTSCKALFLRN
ncbi:hypothetical protein ACJX0J_030603, partial [Zea mays]